MPYRNLMATKWIEVLSNKLLLDKYTILIGSKIDLCDINRSIHLIILLRQVMVHATSPTWKAERCQTLDLRCLRYRIETSQFIQTSYLRLIHFNINHISPTSAQIFQLSKVVTVGNIQRYRVRISVVTFCERSVQH